MRMERPTAYQASVYLTLLEGYHWWRFSVLTDAGKENSALVDQMKTHMRSQDRIPWNLEHELHFSSATSNDQLTSYIRTLRLSGVNFLVLLSDNVQETLRVMNAARLAGYLNNITWIVSEPGSREGLRELSLYPENVLRVGFTVNSKSLNAWLDAVRIIADGVQNVINSGEGFSSRYSNVNCFVRQQELTGTNLYKNLKSTVFQGSAGLIRFTDNGMITHPVYKISTLRKTSSSYREWLTVGIYEEGELLTGSSLLLGHSHHSTMQPIADYNERLRVVAVPEAPFVFVDTLKTNFTSIEHACLGGTVCLKPTSSDKRDIKRLFRQFHSDNTSVEKYCCYGISVTILKKLVKDLNLEYDLYVVADGKYGAMNSAKQWNGVIGDVVNGVADMAIGPIGVNWSREKVIDFSVPYSYSGLNLILSRIDRGLQYTAFLQPLDWTMWVGIFVTLQCVAISITFYEWWSPYGLTPRGRNRRKVFSLPSALTLCWSVLFSHTVTTKSPKCWSSRWLTNVWALFSIVFIASYTANLAAFMVGDHSYQHLSGIEDPRLRDGSIKRRFRMGLVKDTSSEIYMRIHQSELRPYLDLVPLTKTEDGIRLVRMKKLDLFLIDHLLVEYYIRADLNESMQIIGPEFHPEPYAIGLVKHSPLKERVDKLIIEYLSSGYLETIFRVWYDITGHNTHRLPVSIRMGSDTFVGIFLLLSVGIGSGILTLILEYFVFKILVPCLRKSGGLSSNYMALSQRLHHVVNSNPNEIGTPRVEIDLSFFDIFDINKSRIRLWKESRQTIRKKRCNVGERLCEHHSRRNSPESVFSLTPQFVASTASVNTTVTTPLLKASTSIPIIKNNIPRLKDKDNGRVKSVNIAVQTDYSIDALVNKQLKEVDASIERRLQNFEKDLRHMREQLAKALREKENLMRKLHKLQQQLHHKDTEMKSVSMPCFYSEGQTSDKVCNTCGGTPVMHGRSGRCRLGHTMDSSC